MATCNNCGHGPTVKGACPNEDCQFSEAEQRRCWMRATVSGLFVRNPGRFLAADAETALARAQSAWEVAQALWDAKPEDC